MNSYAKAYYVMRLVGKTELYSISVEYISTKIHSPEVEKWHNDVQKNSSKKSKLLK